MGLAADILVIGAGAAGLAAAKSLASAGKRVLVLEGRERCGGRILTHRFPGCPLPVELGAEFIHGEAPETVELARSAGLTYYDIADDHRRFAKGKWVEEEDLWPEMEAVFKKIERAKGPDRSFGEFVWANKSIAPKIRLLASTFVEGFQASELDKISAKSLVGSLDAVETSRRFYSGYRSFVEALEELATQAGAQFRFQAPVRTIVWRKGGVDVALERGETLEAQAALVTLPVGVLKSGGVRFQPDLPAAKQRALARIENGHAHRAVFWFHEPFWENRVKNVSFLHSDLPTFPTWWTALPFREPILTAWAGGGQAIRMGITSEEEAKDLALGTLAKLTGRSRAFLEKQCRGFAFHDWSHDDFARGAYSYLGVDGLKAPAELARPLEGTLFFAGEATAPSGRNGTVDGALASGYRAAQEYLRRQ